MNSLTELFFNHKITEDSRDPNYNLFLGFYYETINFNEELMVKNYLICAEKKNIHAIKKITNHYAKNKEFSKLHNFISYLDSKNQDDIKILEKYYNHFNKSNELIKLYEESNSPAYYNKLAKLYKPANEVKYVELLKKDVENSNYNSAFELGKYYSGKSDFINMLKYYELSAKNNIKETYMELAKYYETIVNSEKTKTNKYKANKKKMIEYYEKAVENNIKEAFYDFSMIYFNQNNIKKYLEILNKGVIIDDDECLMELLEHYVTKKKYGIALPLIEKAIKKNIADGYYYMGNYYRTKSNNSKMIEYFKKHIENGGTSAFFEMGVYYASLNNEEKALEYFDKDDDFQKYYHLGNIYLNKNNKDKMIEYFELFLNKVGNIKDSNKDQIVKTINKLVEHYLDSKNVDKTISLYEKIISLKMNYDREYFIKTLDMICDNNNQNNPKFLLILDYVANYEKNKQYDFNGFCYAVIASIKLYYNKDFGEFIKVLKKYNSENHHLNEFVKFQTLNKIILNNKRKLAKTDDCPICYDTTSLIPFDCFGHYYCETCYVKIDKCAICKMDKNPNTILKVNYDEDNDEEYNEELDEEYLDEEESDNEDN